MGNKFIYDSMFQYIDKMTQWIKTIDGEHHERHEGKAYVVTHRGEVGSGDTFELLLEVADDPEVPHMLFNISGTLGYDTYLIEGTTKTTGTEITPVNVNRNSPNESLVTVSNSPAGDAGGTRIFGSFIGTATAPGGRGGSGGSAAGRAETILKQNTKYLIGFTALDDLRGNIVLDWYEQEPKNKTNY